MEKIFFAITILSLVTCQCVKAEEKTLQENHQKATFAAGCFWGVEKVFSELSGVISTRVGYTGGSLEDPDYKKVCAGITGHAEAIEMVYDPSKVSYKNLLVTFFMNHDPTTPNRQGPDIGNQYRSAIFYHNDEQKETAAAAIKKLSFAKAYRGKIVTELEPAGKFYDAEEYHQKYLQKNPHGYCSIHLQSPKVAEILKESK